MDKIEVDLKDQYWQLYDKYLDFHKTAWTESCYKSEAARLKKIVHIIKTDTGMSGNEFHRSLMDRGYGSYTIKTMLIRAASYYEFGSNKGVFPKGMNPFKNEMQRSRTAMNRAYRPERLKVDFDTAREKISLIKDEAVRDFCMALLNSGLRIEEAYNVNHETSSVVGKGGIERTVFFDYKGEPPSDYRVRTALKEIGLKPHSLRKLLATKLSRSGFSHADIKRIFGWSSITTADKYFQAKQDDKLRQELKEVLG